MTVFPSNCVTKNGASQLSEAGSFHISCLYKNALLRFLASGLWNILLFYVELSYLPSKKTVPSSIPQFSTFRPPYSPLLEKKN